MEEQMDYARVKVAFEQKWNKVQALLSSNDINPNSYDLFIRAFKFEEDVEIWAKNRDSLHYKLISSYKFCSNVGALGPKRKQGDLQIPEGYYSLSKFNPESNYHLSLKVSYPNLSDSMLGRSNNLGGMIFIHGGCNTIGCIPITDDKIKELYVMCVQARHRGQVNIPIHIFPVRLTNENLSFLNAVNIKKKTLDFWTNLKEGYSLFENSREIPLVAIDSTTGLYTYH